MIIFDQIPVENVEISENFFSNKVYAWSGPYLSKNDQKTDAQTDHYSLIILALTLLFDRLERVLLLPVE
jgi:hypothetical protein